MNLARAKNGPPLLRFTAADVKRAHAEWGCTCGPAALAACLGMTLEEVRPHFRRFASTGFVNPTDMELALASAGFTRRETVGPDWPVHGLIRVQWLGPWMGPGVPPKAAYRYTHWVASKRLDDGYWVFDVNAPWLPFVRWRDEIVPLLTAAIKRSSGLWEATHPWEVRRMAP